MKISSDQVVRYEDRLQAGHQNKVHHGTGNKECGPRTDPRNVSVCRVTVVIWADI